MKKIPTFTFFHLSNKLDSSTYLYFLFLPNKSQEKSHLYVYLELYSIRKSRVLNTRIYPQGLTSIILLRPVIISYKVSLFIIDTKDFHKYLVKSTVLNWSNIWIRVLMAILVPDQIGFNQELHYSP